MFTVFFITDCVFALAVEARSIPSLIFNYNYDRQRMNASLPSPL